MFAHDVIRHHKSQWPSSLVAILAIALATSLNRTTIIARAIAAVIVTALRSVAAAITNKLASLRSQGWGTPLYINMEISWPSRHSLYDTQVNATNLSVTDKRSAHESCFNQ